MDKYSSKILEKAIDAFSALPGVGKKTALRHVLHLLKQDKAVINDFIESLSQLQNEIHFCKKCFNLSDNEICEICANPARDESTICVVQDIRDVIAIENTRLYKGLYHVLGGLISPMDGIGPQDLQIESLLKRVENSEKINELIMALSTTMEGDTTNFYIYKKVKALPIKISTIARGVAIGDELEYTDEVTLGRSISNRVLYENTLAQ